MLGPIDRISEVLFGLIMVVTYTGSISVATAGHQEARSLLLGALGCNLAWGIIDAIMYLMTALAEQREARATYRAVCEARDSKQAQELIAGALPSMIASILQASELEALQQRLKRLPEPPAYGQLGVDDWRGALGVFLLMFISALPVVIPFVFVRDVLLALRVSHAIAIAGLFLAGYAYGRTTGGRPWALGVALVAIGGGLAAVTIALGG